MRARDIKRTQIPTCIFGHLGHILVPHLGHIPEHREDDKSGNKARHAVHHAGHQGVSGAENPPGLRHFQGPSLKSTSLHPRPAGTCPGVPSCLPQPGLSHWLVAQSAGCHSHHAWQGVSPGLVIVTSCGELEPPRPPDFKQELLWGLLGGSLVK